MICCICEREIDRDYGLPGSLGLYCYHCANEIRLRNEEANKEYTMIKFVEKICGCPLLEWQKDVIRRINRMDKEERYIVMCRHHGRATIMDLISDFHEIFKI